MSTLREQWPNLDQIPHPAGRQPETLDAQSADFVRPMQQMFDRSQELGPIFETQMPGFSIVVVTGADLAEDLFDDERFEKYTGFGIEAFRPVTGDGLFTAHNDEPNWALAHRILQPAFSREALRRYHPAMRISTAKLLSSWAGRDSTEPLNLADETTTLALDIIGQAGFGFDFGSFDAGNQNHPYVSSMVNALAYSVLPPDIQEQKKSDFESWVRTIDSTVDAVIAARASSGQHIDSDILGIMMHGVDPLTGEKLSAENMRYQVTTFMVAGYGTTASLISFALYFLAQDPQLVDDIRAEIDLVAGDQAIDFDSVARLRAVRRAIDETLRLWPPTPAFLRVATKDTYIGTYEVRQGGWAAVLTRGLHQDPAWGPDRAEFRPDRFRPQEIKKRPGHLYKPFGTGPRMCIGRQFALHAASLAVAEILRAYDLTVPDDYDLKVAEGGFFMPEDLRVTVTARQVPGAEPATGAGHS